MPLLTASPILAYLDRIATINFYTNLGFFCNANWPDYLICDRDSISIHLWKCDDENIPKHTGCYVYVSEIDLLYAEYVKLDIIHPNGKLEDKHWSIRQFSILDNSGNIIHFGQRL